MDKTPQAQYTVTNWEKDYKMLKHIRWVRNQIAHDTSDAPFSTEADLEFTNAFYDRIINQNDPFILSYLTLLMTVHHMDLWQLSVS